MTWPRDELTCDLRVASLFTILLTVRRQVDAWTQFFDALINGGEDALSAARRPLEAYLRAHPAKATSISMSLIKQDIMIDQYAA